MWAMAIALHINGEQPNWAVAGLFAVVIAVCGVLQRRDASELRSPPPGWLGPTLWAPTSR
jgi:hypothetical protein